MKMKLHHTPYIARRISRDLVNCPFVEIRKTKESIAKEVERIIDEDIEREFDLDEKVDALLEKRKKIILSFITPIIDNFSGWLKKRMANEAGVILNNEDRFSDISHKILDYLWEEDFIHYTVSDNQVKKILFLLQSMNF